MEPSPKGYIYRITLAPKSQGTEKARERWQGPEFAMRVYLLVMSETTLIKILLIWLPKHDLIKDNKNRYAKVDGERLWRGKTLQKELWAFKKYWEQEKQSSPCKNTAIDYPVQCLALKTCTYKQKHMYTSKHIQTEQVIIRNIYIYNIYMW